MTKAVLFDLGNTLVAYYRRDEFRPVLEEALGCVLREAQAQGLDTPGFDAALQRALAENREAPDYRFTPMAERFERILGVTFSQGTAELLCKVFLEPIFKLGRLYEDALPTLTALRSAGVKTAIVSNAPWGSPPKLWRRELGRLGLAEAVDCTVLCGDVGWRKPERRIFERAAEQLSVPCRACVFVGDEPLWDVAGPSAVGMRPILLDRGNRHLSHSGVRVSRLDHVLGLLGFGA